MEGGEIDFLALEALAGQFDFLAEFLEPDLKLDHPEAGGFVRFSEPGHFDLEGAHLVAAL